MIKSALRLQKHYLLPLLGKPIPKLLFAAGTIDRNDVDIARSCLSGNASYSGDTIKEFEQTFAQWNGSAFAFSFISGRTALSACIDALGLQPGDEVIIPGYTCIVVQNAFTFVGVHVIHCDIELDTYGPDYHDVIKKVTPKTKAIVLHHLYGLIARDYEAIIRFAKENNIVVIEDCAHALGAAYKGKKAGNLGDLAFYSFEHSKVMSTFTGGMAVTSNPELAAKLKQVQTHTPFLSPEKEKNALSGLLYDYYVIKQAEGPWKQELYRLKYGRRYLATTSPMEVQGQKPAGYMAKMPPSLAAIGLNQLKKLDDYNRERRKNAALWDAWVTRHGFIPPKVIDHSEPVFLRYPVLVNEAMKKNTSWAKALGFHLGVWFVTPVHPSTVEVKDCPNALEAVRRCVNFPTLGIDPILIKKDNI